MTKQPKLIASPADYSTPCDGFASLSAFLASPGSVSACLACSALGESGHCPLYTPRPRRVTEWADAPISTHMRATGHSFYHLTRDADRVNRRAMR